MISWSDEWLRAKNEEAVTEPIQQLRKQTIAIVKGFKVMGWPVEADVDVAQCSGSIETSINLLVLLSSLEEQQAGINSY